MENTQKRTTIYLEPALHKALQLKSIETSKSISALVNQAVKDALTEDAQDIAAYEERTGEPVVSYAEMVKKLRNDGRI